MIKRQTGQVFILVLILLSIGALMTIPALRLTSTSLTSSRVATGQTRSLYAADAAQEYVMWKLLHKDWTSQFQTDGSQGQISGLEICGSSVDITVVMRATEGQSGVILATDDTIQPTKTVSPNATDTTIQDFTYIIKLEQLSSNISRGLDKIYDILPEDFVAGDYLEDSTEIRIDGGEWQPFHDPLLEENWGNALRATWPHPDIYGSANFTSPERDFSTRQVKEIRFTMRAALKDKRTYYNWVVLNVEDVVSVSGPTAPIVIGDGSTYVGGLVIATKASDPEIILPGVETDITYTMNIQNLGTPTQSIDSIIDYLPPDFLYIGPTSNLTTDDPISENITVNGVERLKLTWTFQPDISISGGETLHLVFGARATKDVSGSYYNEVQVVLKQTTLPGEFADSGVTGDALYGTYSWTSGVVIVPAYDSSANSSGVVIDANLALTFGSMTITSYQIR